MDRESQFVAISMSRSRRERLAAALGSFGARAGGGLGERSEVRVSGPLHRSHYLGGPAFFLADSVTRYAASSNLPRTAVRTLPAYV